MSPKLGRASCREGGYGLGSSPGSCRKGNSRVAPGSRLTILAPLELPLTRSRRAQEAPRAAPLSTPLGRSPNRPMLRTGVSPGRTLSVLQTVLGPIGPNLPQQFHVPEARKGVVQGGRVRFGLQPRILSEG